MEPVDPASEWMLRLAVEDGIATLTLDRPDKLNAWSWEATRQLGKRADEIRFDDSVRVVVVRAEGRAFCAGVDLGMPEDRVTGRSPAEKVRNYYEGIRWVHERFRAFSGLPQPIVMAVQGYCLGFDQSRNDLEALGDELREGTRVTIYMPHELEMTATLRFDATEKVWWAKPVDGAITYLDGRA
jgi:hypothetical protein